MNGVTVVKALNYFGCYFLNIFFMAYRSYTAIKSFVLKDAADVCMESGDTLIVRPLPSGEWPDPMSEMSGTNTRTNMAIVFPGNLVELVSESMSESVSHHHIFKYHCCFSCKIINWPQN